MKGRILRRARIGSEGGAVLRLLNSTREIEAASATAHLKSATIVCSADWEKVLVACQSRNSWSRTRFDCIQDKMTIPVLVPAGEEIFERVASAAREGLTARRKSLPPWLFYDEAGSRLFEQITTLREYYLTRTERSILAAHSPEMIRRAAGDANLRLVELGAGSAAKTRLILSAALERQPHVVYQPVDVSVSALDEACTRIESELPGVRLRPHAMDFTRELDLEPCNDGERRLVLFIGSSVGNFEPADATALLRRVRAHLNPGDGFLLGVDLRKDVSTLIAAYDDAEGVTAAFNLNLLERLNRELGAEFDLEAFEHRAIWNGAASRIEMHLVSRRAQRVPIAALGLSIHFGADETIHTENSYKFAPGEPESLLARAGFTPMQTWTDPQQWFAVCLAGAE